MTLRSQQYLYNVLHNERGEGASGFYPEFLAGETSPLLLEYLYIQDENTVGYFEGDIGSFDGISVLDTISLGYSNDLLEIEEIIYVRSATAEYDSEDGIRVQAPNIGVIDIVSLGYEGPLIGGVNRWIDLLDTPTPDWEIATSGFEPDKTYISVVNESRDGLILQGLGSLVRIIDKETFEQIETKTPATFYSIVSG